MKRMVYAAACGVLAACSSPEEMSEGIGLAEAQASGAAGESAQQTLARRTAAGAKPLEFKDEEQDGEAARDFAYGWPREVSAIPALAAQLTAPRDAALAEQKREWRAAVAEFGNGTGEDSCISCVNRSYAMVWKVVADTPRFLSLSAERFTYSGGAHGNSDFDALIWDREEGRALTALDLFGGLERFGPAVYPAYCAALESQQRERRGEYFAQSEEAFGTCPGLDELVILAGSSNGQTFDRLGFLAAPYVAGPYAEGPYEVTLPVTREVLETVKPPYRAAFSLQAVR